MLFRSRFAELLVKLPPRFPPVLAPVAGLPLPLRSADRGSEELGSKPQAAEEAGEWERQVRGRLGGRWQGQGRSDRRLSALVHRIDATLVQPAPIQDGGR